MNKRLQSPSGGSSTNRESIYGSSVLVTGATGFIGSRLVQSLVDLGADVHIISRSRSQSNLGKVTWWTLDLAHSRKTARVVREISPDYVFHLASLVNGSRDLRLVLPTFRNNCVTTLNLLLGLSGTTCTRIVSAGSMEESESDEVAPTPVSPYAASKSASSLYLHLFHGLYGSPIVQARVFMVYGPGQKDLTKLVPYSILASLKKEPVLVDSGTRSTDWIYVDDVVEALVRMALSPAAEGKVIDVGSGVKVTTREILTLIHKLTAATADPVYGAIPDRPLETSRVASADETSRIMDWRASTSLADGMSDTVDWYRKSLATE